MSNRSPDGAQRAMTRRQCFSIIFDGREMIVDYRPLDGFGWFAFMSADDPWGPIPLSGTGYRDCIVAMADYRRSANLRAMAGEVATALAEADDAALRAELALF